MSLTNQQRFWNNFAKNSWEKKYLLAKNFASPVFEISEKQMFLILVKYSDYCRKMNSADGFKLYVNGQLQHQDDVLQFLPEKKDKTLQGYHHKMNSFFSDYCLVCDELLQSSHEIWSKLNEFTTNLFFHVGLPNRFVEMGLYLGNYRKTPFGVHVDGCGVFSFPVVGKKTFRLWDESFAKKNPTLDRSRNYAKFNKSSKIMQASAGDMTYWPSKAWHIAESNGSFSATWSLGVWLDRTHEENVLEALTPLLHNQLGALASEKTTQIAEFNSNGSIKNLPKIFDESVLRIAKISKSQIYDALLIYWMKHSAKNGFKTRPANITRPAVSLNSKIRLNASQKIFWAPLKSMSSFVFAFDGCVIHGPVSRQFIKLVKDLNLKKDCKLSDYFKATKNNGSSADYKTFVKLTNLAGTSFVETHFVS